MTQKINKGEIWLANLNPSKGKEPEKTRPVLILQDQALLDVHHPSTLIIPLTTNLVSQAEPLRIHVKARDDLEKDSDLLIDQMRAIDNQRLAHGPLARLKNSELRPIYNAVCEVMGMET